MKDDEFAEYASARWTMLVGSAVLLGCPASEAEDLAQITLMRAYAAWGKVSAADNRDAYIYKILLNASRERHRRRRWRELSAAEPHEARPNTPRPAAEGASDVDEADAMERALARLDDGQRQAIVLRYFAHLTDQQIADSVGIPLGTVKSRIARGLDRLAHDTSLTDNRSGR